tara:strand:- start:1797 stop:2180 length:384 start_codon:yes stop_codon:yes gene_type:complete
MWDKILAGLGATGGAGGGAFGGNLLSGLGKGFSQAGGGLLQAMGGQNNMQPQIYQGMNNMQPQTWMNPGNNMQPQMNQGMFSPQFPGNQNQMPLEDEEEDKSFDFSGFGGNMSQFGNSLMNNSMRNY